jgi:hypothetical protein
MTVATQPRIVVADGVYQVRFPLTQIQEGSFEPLIENMEAREQGTIYTTVGKMSLEFQDPATFGFKAVGFINDLDGNDHVVNMTENAVKSYLKILGIADTFSLFKNLDNRKSVAAGYEALKAKAEDIAGRKIRVYTAVDAVTGTKRAVYVQSAMHSEQNDLQILKEVANVASNYKLQPQKATIDDSGFRLSLVSLDYIDFNTREVGETAMRIRGAGDVIFPGAEIIISSKDHKNELRQFFFTSACENGCIFGKKREEVIKMERGELSNPDLFSGYFNLLTRKFQGTFEAIQKLETEPFTDRKLIREMCKGSGMTRLYEDTLDGDLIALEAVGGNRYQAYNRVTREAHAANTSPGQGIRLEELMGRYPYL